MFQSLSQRLTGVFDRLKARSSLTEADVLAALREIRVALLEADVALPVVKAFMTQVQEKAVGQQVLKSITSGQMVVKIVHDHLIALLGGQDTADAALNLAITPPAVILMVGLQGAGKTTSSAKLARFIREKQNKKILMASLDVYRPAAQQQLETLGQQSSIATVPIITQESPLEICARTMKLARQQGVDVIIFDTAGRLHVDDVLMEELKEIKRFTNPIEVFLVADAMTGQDAVHSARAFHESMGITGIILTRLDGDSRGGAALSMREITGCPIKFMGVGEKLDDLELFQADRIASRILGMGDIVGLVEKAAHALDQKEVEQMARKMEKGQFTLADMESQLLAMLKMGGFSGIMSLLPGVGKIQEKLASSQIDDTLLRRQIAVIRSMTPRERQYYKLLNASRRRRIARGSGVEVSDVNRLIKNYEQMLRMMKSMNKMKKKPGALKQALQGLMGL